MADDVCVAVRSLSKKFARSLKRSFVYGARDIGRLLLRRPPDDTLRDSEFWAVRNVSFELHAGRSIGIIGPNGSGKTTLLRMICGILRPTLGNVHVRGRIAPMLALGAGFKPVLSGRQNVFLNLALLGVGERETRARFDAIVDFAELHEAIDAPLGTYSSGMKARLGFACAVHTEPSILVVDEVLAVGDQKFRMKCRNRINELRRNGTSLLLVSHSPVLVEALSDQCLYLRNGRTIALGPARQVLTAYEQDSLQGAATQNHGTVAALQDRTLSPDQRVVVRSVQLRSGGAVVDHWAAGQPAELAVTLRAAAPVEPVSVNVMVFDLAHRAGETVLAMRSSRDQSWLRLPAGDSALQLVLDPLGLRPGTYRLKLSVSCGPMHDFLDTVEDVRVVVQSTTAAENSIYHQGRQWLLDGPEPCAAPGGEPELDVVGSDPAADDAG